MSRDGAYHGFKYTLKEYRFLGHSTHRHIRVYVNPSFESLASQDTIHNPTTVSLTPETVMKIYRFER